MSRLGRGWRQVSGSPRLELLRVLPRVSGLLTGAAAVDLVVSSVLPILLVLASGRLIGSVPAAVRDGTGSAAADRLVSAFVAVAVLMVFQQVVSPLLSVATGVLGRRVDERMALRTMAAMAGPSTTAHLEDSEWADLLVQAKGDLRRGSPGTSLSLLSSWWAARATAVTAAVALTSMRWWLGIVVVLGPLLLSGFWHRWYARATAAAFLTSQEMRASMQLFFYGFQPQWAGELRVFGLVDWLTERFDRVWERAMAPLLAEWSSGKLRLAGAELAPAAMHLLGTIVLVWDGTNGRLSLTQVTIGLGAIATILDFGNANSNGSVIEQGLSSLRPLRELEERLGRLESGAGASLPNAAPLQAIRFDGVSFTYPGRELPVFEGLDLELPAGSSTAIVGVNGAGKSTLVKLLCGLRTPDAGRITVDGLDLAGIDRRDWQRRIAAIFQSFIRYELTAADNIGLAVPEQQLDREGIEAAARRSGAADLIEGLPARWETPLHRQLDGGTDLSGGQWQRVAIARALFAVHHGARVLVLDEPSAALDVRTEADLYDRFFEITEGVTSVVISHRFSTVRRAERIVVVDAGRVVEEGSHHDLIDAGGLYAEMFRLQASRFTESMESNDA